MGALKAFFFTLLCTLPLIGSKSHNYDDPTLDELARGYNIKAHDKWGEQAREQKSLRIACIGGSNTISDEGDVGYVHLLDVFVKDRLGTMLYDEERNDPMAEQWRDHSYAHNMDKSGLGAEYFVGRLFPFEALENTKEWPNVILIDTSVNILEATIRSNTTSIHLERLMRSINHKYTVRNLSIPDYMFYNMPFYDELFDKSDHYRTVVERTAFVRNFETELTRYDVHRQIALFASHYGFPVLDWGEALWPAVVRHYLNNTQTFEAVPWKYSHDGVHMSKPMGTTLGQHHLLTPFFLDMMRRGLDPNPRLEPTPLYPASPIQFEITSYSTYRRPGTTNDFRHIVDPQSTWTEQSIPHYDYCVGSATKGSLGIMDIGAPPSCSAAEPCKIQIHMYHSWNASRVGNAACSLHFQGQHEKAPHPGGVVSIIGQSVVGKASFPVIHTFPHNVTVAGMYVVKCVNLEDKLSCACGLDILKSLVL